MNGNRSGFQKFKGVLRMRCPSCGKAKVFHKTKFPYKSRMKDECEACGYRFDREPDYFRGVMIFSLVLALIEGVLIYAIATYFIFGLSPSSAVLASIAAVLFFLDWNYRMARVMWMNIFPA